MVKKITAKKEKVKPAAKVKKETKSKTVAPAKTAKPTKSKIAAPAKTVRSGKSKIASPVKAVKSSKSKIAAPAKSVKSKASAVASSKEKTMKSKKNATPSERESIILTIKQNLLSQRESLLKEAEETISALPTELNFPDMGDQATAETDRNFMLRLRDRERMLLKKIEETIERIDGTGYGICEECGNEIGIKRLEARPVTTYCIDCKTLQEEEERISEGG